MKKSRSVLVVLAALSLWLAVAPAFARTSRDCPG
jgi:hypothetical protein